MKIHSFNHWIKLNRGIYVSNVVLIFHAYPDFLWVKYALDKEIRTHDYIGGKPIYTLRKIIKNLLDFKLWLGAFAAFAIPFGFFLLFKWIRGQTQTKG